ncbi:MAG: DUF2344 domain-containing protein [Clostridiaceae bacterium]|nr:DUF2344 domain-containing protein [Clostridiaceae bacterium]
MVFKGEADNRGKINSNGNTDSEGNIDSKVKTGKQGKTWQTGKAGETGNAGKTGNTGRTGKTGRMGKTGNGGRTGRIGMAGKANMIGNKGKTGDAANTGKAGNVDNPCSIRARFTRGEELKYISHLDIARAFQRALRRSRVPISYSEGFNPQPHVVFGLPLAVGVTSEAEYADFRLYRYMEPGDFMERLNIELPQGLKLCETKIKRSKENIMAGISFASYKIYVHSSLGMGIGEARKKAAEFIKLETIMVPKEEKQGKEKRGRALENPGIHAEDNTGKNNTGGNYAGEEGGKNTGQSMEKNEVNIKSMVHKLDIEERAAEGMEEDAGGFIISALVSAGSRGNLKPAALVSAINRYMKTDFQIMHVHRTGLFIEDTGKITNPLSPRALGY